MSKNWIGRQVQFFVTFSTLHQRAVKVGMYINNCICNSKYEFSSKYSSECYYRNNGRYILGMIPDTLYNNVHISNA